MLSLTIRSSMTQKICPFSFFNFYINKEAAQAGGCHLCVEEACGLWDEFRGQCGLMTGIEAVASIADFSSSPSELPQTIKQVASPISNILEKMRLKKKDAVAETTSATATPVIPTPVTAAIPPAPPPPSPLVAPTIQETKTTNISEIIKSDVLNPPNVPISDLPIISLNDKAQGLI